MVECSIPLKKQETVEPGQEHSHRPGLQVEAVRVVEEHGGDKHGGGHVQHPLHQVIGVQEVPQPLQRKQGVNRGSVA